MRTYLSLLSMAVALVGLSCGGNAPPSQQANGGLTNPAEQSTAAQSGGATTEDVPPADARFTIFCTVVRGADHVTRAVHFKEELIATTKLHGWHIVHTDQSSTICYGYYRTYDDHAVGGDADPKEAARAHGDLKTITAIKDAQGDRLFKLPLFCAVDEKDPESPAAWNLVNAPAKAFWSLQIAAFRGISDRKERAVQAVRDARAAGIEAYYYHDETMSIVCVGTWPEEAVKKQEMKTAQTADPTAIPLLLNRPLPDNVSGDMRDKEGNHVTIIAPKVEINDPTLAKAIQTYPNNAVNGEDHAVRAKNGQLVYDSSLLVQIPHADTSLDPIVPLTNVNAVGGANRAASDILDPTPSQRPAGKLRSLGD